MNDSIKNAMETIASFKLIGITTETINKNEKSADDMSSLWKQFYGENITAQILNKIIHIFLFFLAFFHSSLALYAQDGNDDLPKDWFLADPEIDYLEGTSADKAYQTLLQGRPANTVIVAVIDSGLDIDHEDLKAVVWINQKEIPGNGIDDDKNGYIDDVHGWNFIGGKNGNVSYDTGELTREYSRLKILFSEKSPSANNKKYQEYLKIKERFERLVRENKENLKKYERLYDITAESIHKLKTLLKTDRLTIALLQDSIPVYSRPSLIFTKGLALNLLRGTSLTMSLKDTMDELKNYVKNLRETVNYVYNTSFNPRLIVGDDYNKVYEKNYGNKDVKGSSPTHGTHVAGIIGAQRDNEIGMKGVADKVKIMPIRAVPESGDERDKDIANAIIYAVDNGAQIINMSFGKSFSPHKKAVDEAVRYAEKKNVLIVHASGNAGQNIDVKKNFPSRYYAKGKEAKNWLEVGATSWKADDTFMADFSNYGNKSVDVFAPGLTIFSTLPDNNYAVKSGTSMAAAVVSGVAALLLSYFPELTALQVKKIIRKSARQYEGLKVKKSKEPSLSTILFKKLSSSGGVVDVLQAVKMARKMVSPK